MAFRQTRFSDVCGTMDEMKRLLHEEPERPFSDPDTAATPLIEDAAFMLRRMKMRLEEYIHLAEDARCILSQMDGARAPEIQKAWDALDRLDNCLKSGSVGPDISIVDSAAEEVRRIASALEHRLRANKDAMLKLHELFLQIRGARAWIVSAEDGESHEAAMRRKHQAWLPPEPHCRELLKMLAASRAFVADSEDSDGDPVVQFMDGGAMRMSQVRWDPGIKNFHPASFRPAATGGCLAEGYGS